MSARVWYETRIFHLAPLSLFKVQLCRLNCSVGLCKSTFLILGYRSSRQFPGTDLCAVSLFGSQICHFASTDESWLGGTQVTHVPERIQLALGFVLCWWNSASAPLMNAAWDREE